MQRSISRAPESLALTPNRPFHSVRLFSGVDLADDFELLEIDDDNVVVRRACHEHARAVRLHLNAGSAPADWDSLDFFACRDVEHGYISHADPGDERQLSIRRNLE